MLILLVCCGDDWNPPVPSLAHHHQERRLADLLGLQAGVAVVPAGLAAAAGTGLPPVAAERPGPLAVPPSFTLVWQQTGTVGNWTKWWGDLDCSDCPPSRRGQTEEWGAKLTLIRTTPPTTYTVVSLSGSFSSRLLQPDCTTAHNKMHHLNCFLVFIKVE